MSDFGCLLYSRRAQECDSGKKEVVVLLWKDENVGVCPFQSSRFWGAIMMRFDPEGAYGGGKTREQDLDWISALSLHVGSRIPFLNTKSPKKFVEKRIRNGLGVKILDDQRAESVGFKLTLVPVPYFEIDKIKCLKGYARWVRLDSIMSQVLLHKESLSQVSISTQTHERIYLPLSFCILSYSSDIEQFIDSISSQLGASLENLEEQQENSSNDFTGVDEEFSGSENQSIAQLSVLFRCRKCRQNLFSDLNLVEHQQGQGQEAFAWHKRDSRSGASIACSGFFIDPFGKNLFQHEWIFADVSGRLDCPFCQSKIGSYNLSGSQCSCGAWVAPSVRINSDKVDPKAIIY